MTAPTFEDGAWYWVEKEGWIGDPPTIAPALYKAQSDAWYSFAFSGIPTREVKVLEPCRRAPVVPVPQGWKWVPVEPTQHMIHEGSNADCILNANEPNADRKRRVYCAMLAAAPKPPAA